MHLLPHCVHAENNVHANFHCGVSETLIFCNKIARVALVPLADFSLYVHIQRDVREALHICLEVE